MILDSETWVCVLAAVVRLVGTDHVLTFISSCWSSSSSSRSSLFAQVSQAGRFEAVDTTTLALPALRGAWAIKGGNEIDLCEKQGEGAGWKEIPSEKMVRNSKTLEVNKLTLVVSCRVVQHVRFIVAYGP